MSWSPLRTSLLCIHAAMRTTTWRMLRLKTAGCRTRTLRCRRRLVLTGKSSFGLHLNACLTPSAGATNILRSRPNLALVLRLLRACLLFRLLMSVFHGLCSKKPGTRTQKTPKKADTPVKKTVSQVRKTPGKRVKQYVSFHLLSSFCSLTAPNREISDHETDEEQ